MFREERASLSRRGSSLVAATVQSRKILIITCVISKGTGPSWYVPVGIRADAPARTAHPVGGFVSPFMIPHIPVHISHSPTVCPELSIVPLY